MQHTALTVEHMQLVPPLGLVVEQFERKELAVGVVFADDENR